MPYRFNYDIIEKSQSHGQILSDIFRLRYQVYVVEWGFEASHQHPEGLEYDDFDNHSLHIYARNVDEGQVIGTVRMIFNSSLGFPIERHFDINLPAGIDRDNVAEISRLAISKEFRRRAIDEKIFGLARSAPNQIPRFLENGDDFRRHCEHQLVRGMYINIYRHGRLRGLTHFTAVMARGLYIILKRWGINFIQLGPEQDYHGIRAPYLVSLDSIAHSWERMDPNLYRDAHSS